MQAPFVSLCRKAVEAGQILVNDVDDWFWGLHPENAAFKATNPEINRYANIDYYKEIILLCGAVVVSTEYLATQVQAWDRNLRVVVIPNGVDVRLFPKRRQRAVDPVIGWAGSTAHRSGDLEILRGPFANLSRRHGQRFHHTGHNPGFPSFEKQTGVSRSDLTLTPMLAPHEYPHGLNFDIGVIPLVDVPFNHAKSNIKGLEFAAAGIPFVASPLPEYVRLSEEYGIGRLAKTDRDWVRHLKELRDYDLRVSEGVAIRNAITTHRLDARQQARQWDDLVWSV
jgi:glycosyltransferase involved in cell wall biosynthesis